MPLTYDVYRDSIHMHTKWLAEAGGGGAERGDGEELSLNQSFPILLTLNYETMAFPPKFEVFVLKYQK